MTEAEWLACREPRILTYRMSRWVTGSARKTRLYLSGCCRLSWPLLIDERSRRAVEVAERLADDRAGSEEVREAYARALLAVARFSYRSARGTAAMMAATGSLAGEGNLDGVAFRFGESLRLASRPARREAMAAAQCDLIRDLFGFPPRHQPIDPGWITPRVDELARDIYDGRDYGKMPILGDAIEEAGCANPRILEHCRQGIGHARGCWVLDALTGRSDGIT